MRLIHILNDRNLTKEAKLARVTGILDEGQEDVNQVEQTGRFPLHLAAQYDYADIAKVLLVAPGIDVNQADKEKWAPLHRATWYGCTETVKVLLAAPGINVNQADNGGWTPLHAAARHGRMDIIKLLLAAPDIDVNQVDKNGQTPLHTAVWYGHPDTIIALLAAPGIKVNQADNTGRTPLRSAAAAAGEGRTDIANLLLAAPGIDVNRADNNGWTPLHAAARYGNLDTVRSLLTVPGILVNSTAQQTPLELYLIKITRVESRPAQKNYQDWQAIFSLFLKNGADLDVALRHLDLTRYEAEIRQGNLLAGSDAAAALFLTQPPITVSKKGAGGAQETMNTRSCEAAEIGKRSAMVARP